MRMTEDEANDELSIVSGLATSAERLAWRRKLKRLDEMIELLIPYEERILEIYEERLPLMDKISVLRDTMCHECVHPREYLSHKGTHIECKFCNKLITIHDNVRKRDE